MRIGDKVRLTEGPLLGMHGTIVRSLRRRLVLAVVLGDLEVQIEVERDWIAGTTPLRRWASRAENPKRATG